MAASSRIWVENIHEANKQIEEFERRTFSRFCNVRATKNFGSTGLSDKTRKVLWKNEYISFNGIPFFHLGEKLLECQHGKDRNIRAKRKYQQKQDEAADDHGYTKRNRTLIQDSKKVDCPAQIHMREVMFFPKFKISDAKERSRSNASKRLRSAVQDGYKIDGERRIYIQFPQEQSHQNHNLGKASGIQQAIDPRIAKKIQDLVGKGILSANEMRRHLREYLVNDVFCGQQLPQVFNRRFFPSKKGIRTHIYRAVVRNRFSKCDQVNVASKVEEWQRHNPHDSFFFRQYAERVPEEKIVIPQPGDLQEDDKDEDNGSNDDEVKIITSTSNQPLLFVHQTAWQKDLLAKYGNNICLLDATYRTTRYSLPLFFLAVKTNVDYQVVASFVIQHEDKESIMEALQVLKDWNPSWQPQFFMTDFSEPEIQAVEEKLPGTIVYLCDFHREQAWERWVSKVANGVSVRKDEVLSRLRRIARASTMVRFDHAVQDLRNSDLWKDNKKLQNWFEGTWLSEKQRWAWVFRCDSFTVGVNTNNGLERQNQVFKYSYLQQFKSNSLSGMLTVLIEEFLPDNYSRYIDMNVKFSDGYRRYNRDIPSFLKNRPRILVVHCMERLFAACEIKADKVKCVNHELGHFLVKSQSAEDVADVWYQVKFGDKTSMCNCDCPDWKKWCLPCKHFLAIFHHFPCWQWENLSPLFRNSPYINLDNSLLNQLQPSITSKSPVKSKTEIKHSNHDDEPQSLTAPCFDLHGNNITTSCSLPLHQHSHRSEAAKCREVLTKIKSATYLILDLKVLQELHSILDDALCQARKHIQQEDGLELETPRGKESISSTHHPRSTLNLPLRTKRKVPYAGRVGQKANTYRKHTNIKSLDDMFKPNQCHVVDDLQFTPEVSLVVEKQHCDQPETACDEASALNTGNDLEIIDLGSQDAPVPLAKHKNRKMDTKEWEVMKNGEMLTDVSINVAQNILHHQHPLCEGLEDTVLGSLYQFSPSSGQIVQVLHNGAYHWVSISNIGCPKGNVNYFDSLCGTGVPNPHVTKQIANILHEDGPQLTINVKSVQQQRNSVDCGPYAIAFITTALIGDNPANVIYDEQQLRPHLSKCINVGRLTPFPQLLTDVTGSAVVRCPERQVVIKLCCSCRMPWYPEDKREEATQMVCCDKCNEWFHKSCQNIPNCAFKKNVYWQCSKCIQ